MNASTRITTTSPRSLRASESGIALLMVMLVTSFLSALGFGLMLAVFMDRLATGNMAGSAAMFYAADGGVEFAARELAQEADFDVVLSGGRRSAFADGAPSGTRSLPGGDAVDLTASTNMLNCGKPTTCTAAQMNANSNERPWGANNPRWQLFAYGPMEQFTGIARPAACYLAVWIGDDVREQDGNPSVDAAAGETGHGIVRVHSEAFGMAGSRRAIEAELARVCPADLDPLCLPGIRVQSWQEVRQVQP
jgi:hypothetical protein